MTIKGMLIESSDGGEYLVSIPEGLGHGAETLTVRRRGTTGWMPMHSHPRRVLALKALAIVAVGKFIKHCGIVPPAIDGESFRNDVEPDGCAGSHANGRGR